MSLFKEKINLISGLTNKDANINFIVPQFHSIHVDNVAASSLGLDVINLTVLQDWYVLNTNLVMNTFAHELIENASKDLNFSVWRNSLRNGQYKLFKEFEDWTFEKYNHNTLAISEFDDPDLILSDAFIAQIIHMNDYIVNKKITEPNEEDWDEKDKARAEFLRDIKSSKERCISWSTQIVLKNAGGPILLPETVNYKLFLYDNNTPAKFDRKITLRDFNIVSSKQDYVNGEYKNKEDGEIDTLSIGTNPNEYIAGGLDIKYNEFTGKWESGSPQLIATLTTNIPAATGVDLQSLILNDIETSLLSPDIGQQIVTGSAIPITMQNANPLQWSPNYIQTKTERQEAEDDNEEVDNLKRQMKIYNLAPRSWASGEMVLLNRVDGIWFPISFGEPTTPVEEKVIGSVDGPWQFMYFLTNSKFYFRNSDNNRVSYTEYEQGFYKKYYLTYDIDNLNVNRYPNADVSSSVHDNGYFQFTSFDFMKNTIGGIREDGHTLGTTQFYKDPLGNDLNRKMNAQTSAPFFGCVFPDGYNPGDKFSDYKTRTDFNILAVNQPNPDKPLLNSPFLKHLPLIDGNAQHNAFEDAHLLSSSFFNSTPIFADQNNPDLIQLPADIALNASPEGINGQPIIDIHTIFDSLRLTNDNIIEQSVKPYQLFEHKNLHWLRRSKIVDDKDEFSELDSAFDFEPKNKGRIQFRPLKAELYALFEPVTEIPPTEDEYGFLRHQLFSLITGYGSPIGTLEFQRTDFINALLFKDSNPAEGFRYNIELINNGNLPSENSLFPFHYWNQDWMASPSRPAGAVGVISAVTTVTADSEISFITDNFLGMASTFAGATAFGGSWYPSWGNASNNYDSFNTTVLFAKVYHSWPRNQTIYDPRFFSVFHFNHGKEKDDVEIDLYNNGVLAPLDAISDPNIPVGYPNGLYSVHKMSSEVDIKIPTLINTVQQSHNNVGFTINQPNFIIYSDLPMRDKKDWQIDTKRRQKLLPFSYTYKTIGIDAKIEIVTEDLEFDITDIGLAISNKGSGYVDGDLFTTTGGDGKDVLLDAITINGEIIGFNILNNGRDFSHTDFFPNFDDQGNITKINNSSFFDAKVKIVPQQITNPSISKGFSGFICRGSVTNSAELTDKKPEIATSNELLRLTPNAAAGDLGGDFTHIPELDQSNYEVVAKIDNPSETNKYDIFFHFHNDISHTWTNSDLAPTPLAYEQQVTLEILPK